MQNTPGRFFDPGLPPTKSQTGLPINYRAAKTTETAPASEPQEPTINPVHHLDKLGQAHLGPPPGSPDRQAWEEAAARAYIDTGSIMPPPPEPWKPTPLPPELERRILAAAVFRLIGSDMFAANIAELDKQIAAQPFAVHLLTLRLQQLAKETLIP